MSHKSPDQRFAEARIADGREPMSVVRRRLLNEFLANAKVEDTFPSSAHRLGYLEDRDEQLRRLLNVFERSGIPMGSSTWADRAALYVEYLLDVEYRVWRWINDQNSGDPDLPKDYLKDSVTHARAMLAKNEPKPLAACDCCGWPGGRRVGPYSVCLSCLPLEEGEDNAPS